MGLQYIGRKLPKDVLGCEGISALTLDETPRTHFFFEFERERVVEPFFMVEAGIALWHEQSLLIVEEDTNKLWGYATELLEAPTDSHVYSRVEWLRYKAILGMLEPSDWESEKPYPYRGMLVSAIYFQEARRLCDQGKPQRAWHIAAIAYYYLGMNTVTTAAQNAKRAATIRHAKKSEYLRALVLASLKIVEAKGVVASIEQAKNKVHDLFKERAGLREGLRQYAASAQDAKVPYDESTALEKFRQVLDDWARPGGPYPQIADAFSRFNKTEQKHYQIVSDELSAVDEEAAAGDYDYYFRIINDLGEGRISTSYFRRDEEE